MSVEPIRRVLQAFRAGPGAARPLTLQHLGFRPSGLDTLPALLEGVSRELALPLQLDGRRGEVVLADEDFVAETEPSMLSAFLDQRPLVTLRAAASSLREGQMCLAQQLRDLTRHDCVPATPGGSDARLGERCALPPSAAESDSGFDSRIDAQQLAEREVDPDRAELLNRLRSGLIDPAQTPFDAGYEAGASMSIDFATGMVLLDDLADQRLRVSHELPSLAHGAKAGPGARERELDRVVWDIALAAGEFRLLCAPADWWHAPLIANPRFAVTRYTSRPAHLEMARQLRRGPVSPAQLRRLARVPLAELRGFVQACLFLGLIYWLPAATR